MRSLAAMRFELGHPLIPAFSPNGGEGDRARRSARAANREGPSRFLRFFAPVGVRGATRPTFSRQTALAFGVLLLLCSTAFGQSPATNPVPSDNSIKALESRLAEARTQLLSSDAQLTNAPAGVSPQDIGIRRALAHRIVRLYEQQLSKAAELETAKARKAALLQEAQSWTRFSEPLPYSILLTDRLREELQAERLKINNGQTATAALEQLIEENRKSVLQSEARIRQLNEQLEQMKDPAASARLAWMRELERLQGQEAGAAAATLELERLMQEETLAESRIRLPLLQRQLIIADAGAKFTQADLDKVLAQIEQNGEQIERELATAQSLRPVALRALESAREELSRQPAAPLALETVSAREAQLAAADTAIHALRMLLEAVNAERATWEMRFASYDTRSVETLRESKRRLDIFDHRLELWKNHQRQQADVSSSQIQLQQTRLNSLPANSELLPLARERLAALQESDRFHRRIFQAVERLERLIQRWDDGLRATEGKLPLLGRFRNLFSDAGSFLQKFWDFELFTAEDTITVDGQKITGRRAITIGKIVMAVFILVAGVWITGLLSRLIEPIIIRRLKIEPNQASLIRRWIRAFMVVCLILFSMVSVKIPLTVFAFAGGALAIGLGFGMQNLLKNFVSGLILLFERPFRVGDVLAVGGQQGTVTSIGLRASILQLWDGTETLIPNSSLLENNVTNWTYSNRKVRFTVTVGVAYGSDQRRVIQLLGEVADRHGLVEKEPKPQVLFTEFGDSTLTFELRFWVDVSRANAAQVSSELRLMIASCFAENGISIDFPQRDIHLHASRPLQVEVVAAAIQGKLNRAEASDAGNGPAPAPRASASQTTPEKKPSTESGPS